MKQQFIPTRETERRVLIDNLHQLGIFETVKREPIEGLDYYELRALLAKKKVVAQ
ncbi:hypothetical protein NCCP2222_19480 [Sporosarcina sp. NCCP-2222]|uniref:hypothetical protein n=1 Tax=Sporosarcina sp. NCCP-2222 TaxID=2935073 RepID=UPI002085549C|nr:hypothetical protein [Sporosarcina sp. NCCP-2222]GKV56001.1 hypothetical protein NCCP2222_19480 [Sporosarcina sp. NCCP-2222]